MMDRIGLLKGKIKDKFGTITRFCRAAEINKNQLVKLLYYANSEDLTPGQQRKLSEYKALLHRSDPYGSPQVDITPRLLKLIRRAVDASGGVAEWHKSHPEFTLSTVKGLYHGYLKMRTPKINKILEKLNIK